MPRNEYTLPGDFDQLQRMAVYPGVIAEESKPLRAFLRLHGQQFDRVLFNFRLGAGMKGDDSHDDATRRMLATWDTLRPDCVAMKGEIDAWIIEAKQDAANDAIWQIKSYRDAYREQFPGHRLRLILVCQSIGQTALRVASDEGVSVFVYTFPPGQVDINAPAVEQAPGAGAIDG